MAAAPLLVSTYLSICWRTFSVKEIRNNVIWRKQWQYEKSSWKIKQVARNGFIECRILCQFWNKLVPSQAWCIKAKLKVRSSFIARNELAPSSFLVWLKIRSRWVLVIHGFAFRSFDYSQPQITREHSWKEVFKRGIFSKLFGVHGFGFLKEMNGVITQILLAWIK